jgi:ABC-2 type transport system permease protein
MKTLWTIYKKELKLIFSTWVGYVVAAMFLLLTGYFFYDLITEFARVSASFMNQQQMQQMQGFPYNINEHLIRFLFGNTSVILLFVVPLLTMRIFSEEKKSGTIEMLITSPVKDYQIVLGKYLATLTVLLLMLFITCISLYFLNLYAGEMAVIEWGPVAAGYLGLFFLGAAYLAIGIFVSSLTENQIISSVGTFAVLLVLWIVGWTDVYSSTGISEFLRRLSLNNHYDNFSKGVISLSDTVFFVGFIFFFLVLTGQSLETAKWRGSK